MSYPLLATYYHWHCSFIHLWTISFFLFFILCHTILVIYHKLLAIQYELSMHPYQLSINQLNQSQIKTSINIIIFHIIFPFIFFIWINNKYFNININHTIQNSTFILSSNSAFSFNGNFMAGNLVKSEFVRLSVVFMRYFPYSFILNLFMVSKWIFFSFSFIYGFKVKFRSC